MKKTWFAKLIVLAAAFLWGMGFLGVQGALNNGWLPFAILGIRGLVAGVVLLVAAIIKEPIKLRNRGLWKKSSVAGLVMGGAFILQSYGQAWSNVSIASILTGLYVLFTPILAVFVKKQKLGGKVYLAGIIAFIAVVLISYDHSEMTFELGEILLIVAAIGYSFHFLFMESLADYRAAFATSAIQQLVMGLASLVLLYISGGFLPREGWLYVSFLALFCSAGAFVLQSYSQQKLSSSVASILLSFECVFGVMGGILVFKEALNWQVVASCGLMLLAIYLLESKT